MCVGESRQTETCAYPKGLCDGENRGRELRAKPRLAEGEEEKRQNEDDYGEGAMRDQPKEKVDDELFGMEKKIKVRKGEGEEECYWTVWSEWLAREITFIVVLFRSDCDLGILMRKRTRMCVGLRG